MFDSLKAADRLGSSLNDIAWNAESLEHSDYELQIAQSQICVHGRAFEITVLIRPITAQPPELLPACGGRKIPVMTAPRP